MVIKIECSVCKLKFDSNEIVYQASRHFKPTCKECIKKTLQNKKE